MFLFSCRSQDVLFIFRCQQMTCLAVVLFEMHFIVILQLSSTRIFTYLYRFRKCSDVIPPRNPPGFSSSIIWNFALLIFLFFFYFSSFLFLWLGGSSPCLFNSLVHPSTWSTLLLKFTVEFLSSVIVVFSPRISCLSGPMAAVSLRTSHVAEGLSP